jgi:hypothetical protein
VVHTAAADQCLALSYYVYNRRNRAGEGAFVSWPRDTADAARAEALDACRRAASAPGACTIRVLACGQSAQTN